MSGKHIEVFLVDGEPGGITTASISGWTGHILSGPRTALPRLLSRDEARRNGVYLLLGDDPDAIEGLSCYIGRTEDSFYEGHWGYLEARLIEIATISKRCSLLDNAQTPQARKLSEAQQSDADPLSIHRRRHRHRPLLQRPYLLDLERRHLRRLGEPRSSPAPTTPEEPLQP
ncbi:hypothetical protein [Buchananella hordeovulneris]|uniref:hypothetical protein n=1 Tax=Buchananella hordeovulneris TaxID=52770 RepID=UPI0026DAA6B2|nr:hypothetical protein [Buchananella hordeovulneris]MDO5081518.1 hypothetical protein [Buchananella hordeovulneris]